MKKFNTTGLCIPGKHYMVDITERLVKIRAMVDEGDYFCINRARQYGKTTTITALTELLAEQYIVISTSFESIAKDGFKDETAFVKAFCRLLRREFRREKRISNQIRQEVNRLFADDSGRINLGDLFDVLLDWCDTSDRQIVLMIDEVDSATNNQVFLDFLAGLRDGYINRDAKGIPAFQSVILTGVTDVRHLRLKIRPDEVHRENSPWNIAADFNIDMSLSEEGIRGMLDEYEADHHTGMDTAEMAKQLRAYTSGYPYLVSRLCQLMDGPVSAQMGSLPAAWTLQGLDEAIKIMLADGNDTLFGSMMSKLNNSPTLKTRLREVLMQGRVVSWQPFDPEQSLLWMYGFIVNHRNTVAISNRIFEMRLYQSFLGETDKNDAFSQDAQLNKSIFLNADHTLNMPLILEHFVQAQRMIHGDGDEQFLEKEGRERFLTYLSPIINGTGTYSIEEQTRDARRMDVVVHYLGQRYVIELKIWHGQRYNAAGEQQIMDYLDYFGLSTGYLVSFCFNQKKEPGVKRLSFGDKVLFEATV